MGRSDFVPGTCISFFVVQCCIEVFRKDLITLERFSIAGYCRISVDKELDRDNTSIENRKAIIEDYVRP